MATWVTVLVSLFMISLMSGCAGMTRAQQRMSSGGAIGAGFGAAIGSVSGGSALTGAVVGGVAGAAAGAIIQLERGYWY